MQKQSFFLIPTIKLILSIDIFGNLGIFAKSGWRNVYLFVAVHVVHTQWINMAQLLDDTKGTQYHPTESTNELHVTYCISHFVTRINERDNGSCIRITFNEATQLFVELFAISAEDNPVLFVVLFEASVHIRLLAGP